VIADCSTSGCPKSDDHQEITLAISVVFLVDIHWVLVDIVLDAVCSNTPRKGMPNGELPLTFGEISEQL